MVHRSNACRGNAKGHAGSSEYSTGVQPQLTCSACSSLAFCRCCLKQQPRAATHLIIAAWAAHCCVQRIICASRQADREDRIIVVVAWQDAGAVIVRDVGGQVGSARADISRISDGQV